MKKRKMLISLAAAFALLASVAVPALAADTTYTYSDQANTLHDLGLYNGISQTEFDPDLGTALDRQTGVVMLLRLFGLEGDAHEMSDEDAAAALAKFSDADEVSAYSKKAVAYAVENGILNGRPDGSISGAGALGSKAYCTMILRQLGFADADYNNAPAELAEKGGLTAEEAQKFADKELIKDDLVGISFGALSATDKDGKMVIEKLVDAGVVEEDKAVGHGLMNDQVEAAVAAYENAPLKTLKDIDVAKKLREEAQRLIDLLPEGDMKTALQARITEHDKTVADKESLLKYYTEGVALE